MELYQLRTFAMVAEVGNLTRAAERLHTSQPAVSAHIKALEAELGLSLFERMPKGMQLTPAGSALAAKAAVALSAADAVQFEANRLKGELTLMLEKEARDPDSDGKFFIVREDVGAVDLSLVYLRRRADDPLISAILQAVKIVWNVD